MKQYRTIESIFSAPAPHMVGDGFRVAQYLPAGVGSMDRLSPFLLLDYHAPYYYEPSRIRRGVGAHPHRGFETVTIAYEGKVEHHDNKGNHGIIGSGDVQWMTAASGIMHKEYHEEEFSRNGGVLHMIQLWVNLPSHQKMSKPKYQALLKEDMGTIKLENDQGEISIIAGEVQGVKGAASTFTDINLYNVKLKNKGKIVLSEPDHFNIGIMILVGDARINGDKTAKEGDFIVFYNEEGDISVESLTEEVLFVVLSGEPIHESVEWQGPFVMNTKEELYQAYDDLRSGKFGTMDF